MKTTNLIYCEKILISIILLLVLTSCSTTQTSEKKVIGRVTIDEWMFSSGWDNSKFNETEFDNHHLEIFNKLTENHSAKFIIFASSSCLECAGTLPYFLKLLTQAKYPQDSIHLIGLDDYWEEPEGMHKKYKLNEIPIVYIELESRSKFLRKNDFINFDRIITVLNEN
jgi:hypothetical protein